MEASLILSAGPSPPGGSTIAPNFYPSFHRAKKDAYFANLLPCLALWIMLLF
jgi:hypothetical protein